MTTTFSFKSRLGRVFATAVSIVLSSIMMATGCGKQIHPDPPCQTVLTAFKQLYDDNITFHPAYSNIVGMDFQTHEYKFKVSANKTICKVGYDGNAALYAANIPYTIEIADASGTILYTGSHRFASGSTDYQTLSTTVNITAGQLYTVRRIMSNPTVSLDKLQGRLLSFNSTTGIFPVVMMGVLEITASNFYGRGGPMPNMGIPYIDIVFQ